MLAKQLVNKQMSVYSPALLNRCFSESTEQSNKQEEIKESNAAEEVLAPVYHNQFSHVISFIYIVVIE